MHINNSFGTREDIARSLRFLNYPLISAPSGALDVATYTLHGWYYKTGREWLSALVKAPDGSQAEVTLQRLASLDIQFGVKDPDASHQRFHIRTQCSDECVLQLETPHGEHVEKKLVEFRGGRVGFSLGAGHVHVDSTDAQLNPMYTRTRLEEMCNRIRVAVLAHYNLLFMPVLVLGALGFAAATLSYRKGAVWNTCYILALACWMLAFLRVSLLVLIDVTSFPAVNGLYLAPAYLPFVAGAVLSCAAWLQIWSWSDYTIQGNTGLSRLRQRHECKLG